MLAQKDYVRLLPLIYAWRRHKANGLCQSTFFWGCLYSISQEVRLSSQ